MPRVRDAALNRRLVATATLAAFLLGCVGGSDVRDDTAAVATTDTGSVAVVVESPPTDPVATTATTTPAEETVKDVVTRSDQAVGDGVRPEGFTTVDAVITAADGTECVVCLWLADTSDERSRGLMGVTDLGAAVGMVFVWDEATSGRFFMLDTPTPLSIAFFDARGAYVSQADMEPCLTQDSADCPRYSADGDYVHAIEMFRGQLDAVGIGPGARLELRSGTEAADCAALG